MGNAVDKMRATLDEIGRFTDDETFSGTYRAQTAQKMLAELARDAFPALLDRLDAAEAENEEIDAPSTFILNRTEDETGISGTGRVAWGCVFPDGRSVLRWASEHRSTAVYDSLDDLRAIHGHGGKTEIVWVSARHAEEAEAACERLTDENARLRDRIAALADALAMFMDGTVNHERRVNHCDWCGESWPCSVQIARALLGSENTEGGEG